ncbi:UDP-N-acetylmuramate dehydrogenase [Aetokthonos hydrillicola Thurmond2011]|uniref:UDP-N-acetylenolpyruvoylglucosamine reductase n=1 Tax=Aetokthonos hydrillicola Thurmond2011 TaxID=2712845 RepID=A0AAP5IFC8_9CYAN|nr:UDP-N-acetylmuramate dehydrogenase [Aetokthonos hydrillicola]MBO3463185.1 UDP-N-acetylmuramate dehydrogenase [Aetokthonos hydrillicola CCALA 1050]MBW4584204.1 UDP-N-acetylmuramate dehydrogenase [Aetokthonos hydrillicola CCALA 1050]MDR9898588.1 UDP-N-acetylmuramate dehydrogenase [Aetokthonos hydrillicola Thurmond2011]
MTISRASANVCTFSGFNTTKQILDNSDQSKEISLIGTDCKIRSKVSLAGYTSYRVGGPAQLCVTPRNLEALQASFKYAKSHQLPVTILGAGSNLLISDCGISGLVIVTRHLRSKHFDPTTGLLTVAAGEPIPGLAWELAERGWQGLEWAVGIPGTVGGAVVMNAGAHGGCISEILVSAQVLSSDGTLETLSREQLGYSYRTSILQGKDRIVTQATFQLQPGADPVEVLATTKRNKHHRLSTQPYHLPSCGSVFRNPTTHAAGWLIEQTGLKGYQIGKAQVAERHANFIVNCGGASAYDIFTLIRHIQEEVQRRWSILLEPEVKMIGEF